jgi:hypothetical protein
VSRAFTDAHGRQPLSTMPLVVLLVVTPAAAVGGIATLLYAAFRRSSY